MINKILISRDKRIILHRDKRTLGMNGENLQEVLLFVLDEKIEGTGIVEVELPDGKKGMIEVEYTEEGYKLPVKSSLMAQTGGVKFQLRILHDDVEIFKSEIISLEVKDSINATETIPEQYPTWIDVLENLKQDLEKAEQERVLNENERISAEEERQENFTEMQKTVESAVSNIKDLTEEYNSNAEKETKKFNDNAAEQTKSFNENSDTKLAEYNKNHTDKEKEFNDNFDTKTKTFDDNAAAKLEAYNKNDTEKTNVYNANDKSKTDAYNDNTVLKEKAYNNNASNKTETFNSNAESKQNEYNQNAENKLTEYNQNAEELINKVEQVQAENEALKAENKLIKEQIPSANISGNSIYIEDSSNLDFDWKINGNQYQATREGYNLLDFNVTQNSKVTVDKPYEQYGASPSVDYPSEIVTVGQNGNVEIEVYNKNLYNFKNKASVATEIITNEEGWITATFDNSSGSSNKYMNYITGNLKLKNSTQYAIIVEIKKVSGTGSLIVHSRIGSTGQFEGIKTYDFSQLSSNSKEVTLATTRSDLESINWGLRTYLQFKAGQSGSITFRISVVEDTTVTASNYIYIPHQSYTKVLPIQQEMLEGDYVADVEHHEWEKLVLTGNENFVQQQNANKLNYFYLNYNLVKIKADTISNMLKKAKTGEIWNKTSYEDLVAVSDNKQTINIMLSDTTITTLQQFKEKLKELYSAGTPIIIYYELAEPIDLELTSEQKAVREQKLYTYKNITNISLSDELASIDVEYKKDQDTINKNYENRLAALEAASIS